MDRSRSSADGCQDEEQGDPEIQDAVSSEELVTVGDSYDNALAESINGLYETELIHRDGPWSSTDAVELATLDWVDWFNNRRIVEPLGYVPPVEFEEAYYNHQFAQAWAA